MTRSIPFWLLFFCGLIAYGGIEWSGFKPVMFPDSHGYLGWDGQNWREQLTSIRTPGYPWLLVAIQWVGGAGLIPPVQFLLNVGATLAFFAALVTVGVRPWIAWVAALPLLVLPMARHFSNAILTDCPGLSLAVVAVACLLWTVGRPRRLVPWLALTVAVVAAWQVRPMYLFLVVFIPALGGVLRLISPDRSSARAGKVVAGLVLAVLLPVLIYSGLRWATVGHFGVVSMGGHELAGIAMPLLSEETLQKLPAALQPLATAIQEQRRQLGLMSLPQSFNRGTYNYWHREFNRNIHDVAWPLALRLNQGDRVQANRDLSRISIHLLRHYPAAYFHWIRFSMVEFARLAFLGDPLLQLLALLLVLVWLLRVVYTHGRQGGITPHHLDHDRALAVMAVTGISFFLAASLAIAMVEAPIDRYVYATGAFLNSVLAVALYREVARFLPMPPPR